MKFVYFAAFALLLSTASLSQIPANGIATDGPDHVGDIHRNDTYHKRYSIVTHSLVSRGSSIIDSSGRVIDEASGNKGAGPSATCEDQSFRSGNTEVKVRCLQPQDDGFADAVRATRSQISTLSGDRAGGRLAQETSLPSTCSLALPFDRTGACSIEPAKFDLIDVETQRVLGSSVFSFTHAVELNALDLGVDVWAMILNTQESGTGVGSWQASMSVSCQLPCTGSISIPLQTFAVGDYAIQYQRFSQSALSNGAQRTVAVYPSGLFRNLVENPPSTTGHGFYPDSLPSIRCDRRNSEAGPGGCVFPSYPGLWWIDPATYPTLASHVLAAQLSGLPGGMFEDLLLHRGPIGASDSSRAIACGGVASKANYSCDEYPPASTVEGASSTIPGRTFPFCDITKHQTGSGSTGFSACMIVADDNSLGGSDMNYQWDLQRVLPGDDFFAWAPNDTENIYSFSDLSSSGPFYNEATWAVNARAMDDLSNIAFFPTIVVDREKAAEYLYKVGFSTPTLPACDSGLPRKFSDVPASNPDCGAIELLAGIGVITGWSDGTFRPTLDVSRQALSAFMYRLSGSPSWTCSGTVFSDIGPSSPFCVEIEWLAHVDVISGYDDGTFKPTNNLTRQAMAAFCFRWDRL